MKLSIYTPIIVIGVFVLLFALEKLFPLRESKAGLLARLIVNAAMSGLTFLIALLVVRPSALSALKCTSAEPFGLMHCLRLPALAEFIAGFLLLHLSFYYLHTLNHNIPSL